MQKEDIRPVSSVDSGKASREHSASLPRTEWERMISSRKFILLILFCVTGALGLPLLWISSAFDRTEKVLWSLANLIYTVVLIALCIAICMWAYARVLRPF